MWQSCIFVAKQMNKIYRGRGKLDFKIVSDDKSIIVVEVYKIKF